MDMCEFPVLLVEDNEDDILCVQRAFRRAKLSNALPVVEDGDAAVAYLSGQGEYADRNRHPMPTLILLDIKLPRRSGLEVLEWLRAQAGLRRIPVVMLTSSKESADVDRAFDLGASGYLVKPVDFDGLLEMVKTIGVYWMVMSELPSAPLEAPPPS
ncbi:response regulator [Belnapia sp. T18]|uniref:Response regulator n=1 Tax=Belnapia arida TaxID=2804533 RepID=A0ABS1UBN0_9PROT|nr:response regulator [Belnapia arida]MBL6080666.1 response regulator [Belnapia arida]